MPFLEFAFASPARYFGILLYVAVGFVVFGFTLGLIKEFWGGRR